MKLGLFTCWSVGTEGGRHYTLGCHQRYLEEYCKRLDRVVLVATMGPREEKHDCEINYPNLKIISIPYFNRYIEGMFKLPHILAALLRLNTEVDAVYVRVPSPYCWLPRIICGRKKKILMHVCGDTLDASQYGYHLPGIVRKLFRAAYMPEWLMTKWALKKTEFIVNGEKAYLKLKHLNENCAMVISTTLRDEDFFMRETARLEEKIVILYLGHIRAAKGIDVLIEAFKLIKDKYPRAQMLIAGSGEYLDVLQRKVEQEGLDEKIVFTGHVCAGEQRNTLYRGADIFVFPSYSEGSPRVVIEAMANSLPVITTTVGGLGNRLKDGEDALLVKPGSAVDIASAIARMIDDIELRRRCSINGYRKVLNHKVDAFIQSIVDRFQQHGAFQ